MSEKKAGGLRWDGAHWLLLDRVPEEQFLGAQVQPGVGDDGMRPPSAARFTEARALRQTELALHTLFRRRRLDEGHGPVVGAEAVEAAVGETQRPDARPAGFPGDLAGGEVEA